jgi:hypothetical protein
VRSAVCADHRTELFHRLNPETLKSSRRQRGPVPFRILQQEVSAPIQGDAERLSRQGRTTGVSQGREVSVARQAIPQKRTIGPPRAFPDFADRFGIAFGKGAVPDLLSYQRFGVEVAPNGVVQDAVRDLVERVTSRDGRGSSGIKFVFRQEIPLRALRAEATSKQE